MSVTASAMVPIGSTLPPFSLPDSHGKMWSKLENSPGTLVIFMCNHCPYVIHVATLLEKIEILCSTSEIQMIGINSNDVQSYPYDSTANMVKIAQDYKWRFPYLVDESQKVARVFRATCTPDAFLYDDTNRLYYRGQFDDSRPSNGVANGEDLLHALQEMLNGAQPPAHQKPSTGCNIKWKS